MWACVKWTFLAIVAMLLIGVFHYSLPHHDIVHITDAYNRETTIGSTWLFYGGSDVAPAETEERDIRFIEAIRPDGEVSVYRIEDTSWLWPP